MFQKNIDPGVERTIRQYKGDAFFEDVKREYEKKALEINTRNANKRL